MINIVPGIVMWRESSLTKGDSKKGEVSKLSIGTAIGTAERLLWEGRTTWVNLSQNPEVSIRHRNRGILRTDGCDAQTAKFEQIDEKPSRLQKFQINQKINQITC